MGFDRTQNGGGVTLLIQKLLRMTGLHGVSSGVETCERTNTISWCVLILNLRLRIRGCIQKFPDWVDNEIYAYLSYYSLRSNTKGYGGKTR
jgi:hypothetical protein